MIRHKLRYQTRRQLSYKTQACSCKIIIMRQFISKIIIVHSYNNNGHSQSNLLSKNISYSQTSLDYRCLRVNAR